MIENFQAVLQAVLRFIRVELKSRIGLFLARALETLRDRVHATFSARQQSRVAERWLADNKPALETALHQQIMTSFTGDMTRKEVPYDELKLLDDESLNVVMLRAKLVSSLMEKARDSVVALEVRLEALKQSGAQINTRAFTPGAIADGLIGTLEQLSVPTEVQILLMEAYSESGAEMLAEFYKDFNEILASNGVIPGFNYSIIKTPPSKKKTGAQAGSWSPYPGAPAGQAGAPSSGGAGPAGGAGTGSGSAPGSGGDAQSAGGKQQGMDWAPPWPAVSSGAAIPAHFAQLLDAKLSAMQQALSHLTAESWEPGTLRDTFKIPPPISLSPEQEESIDHIEAVFLDLIRDTRISSRFRTELNRLILPLMSLRLTDAELFKDPENPVRRFIRQLALLGFRDLESPISEFEHISLIVGRIVSERAQEIASFSSGADALYTIARNEVRLQMEARLKTSDGASDKRGKSEITDERVEQSHQFVRATLKQMSAGFHLPSVVQHFILRMLAPWMMVRYQRHGEDSEKVQESMQEAATFFVLLEPATDEDDHYKKIERRKRMLEQMAFRVLRSRMKMDDMRILLEGVAEYFDTLNGNPGAGITRSTNADDEAFVSYLDDLPVTRAS